MKHRHVRMVFKGCLFLLWAGSILGFSWFIHSRGIQFRHLPGLIRSEVRDAGPWGPLMIVGLYGASTILLFSKGTLDIVSGTIYGSFGGSLIAIIGLNIAAMIAFAFARFFARRFVQKHERGWIKKYDDVLAEEGFMAVLFMRLLFFPFDIVSLGCGISRMSFRQFAFGTLLGSIPGTVTLVVLGGSLHNPKTWFIFGALFILTIGSAFLLRRLPWTRKRLYKEPHEKLSPPHKN
jgi:uncharacterized membrane protein YdjX (TVP38/TMEM64 family)